MPRYYVKGLILSLLIIIFSFSMITENYYLQLGGFNCSGRLQSRYTKTGCDENSTADVFLSMHSNGKGYLLVSGSWSCEHSTPNKVEGMINFKFEQEGGYYSVQMSNRNPQLESVITALRYHTLKLKITRLNSGDYILRLPNETLMMCKAG